jgi:ATPase subunit of ABC transporter with duplicated ATPase domains
LNCGDRLGLVDPNAAGKTTLFNLFLGKESTDKGSVNMECKLELGFYHRKTF